LRNSFSLRLKILTLMTMLNLKRYLYKAIGMASLGGASLKAYLIGRVRSEFVKRMLIMIFKTAVTGGLKTKIVKWLLVNAFDEVIMPLMKEAFNILGYGFDKTNGKIKIWKRKRAEEQQNEDDYIDIITSL